MASNKNLHTAHRDKNDEFYTQYVDIENEVKHYTQHFRGKIVYCNTDTEDSNFYKYFSNHFTRLGLKDLIISSSDFRSPECVEILKEADIVVTNPPFSLFREYVAQLVDHKKKFLIIGNLNAITYKNFFPLLKDNKIWLGPSISSGDREFQIPDHYEVRSSSLRVDEHGNKYVRVSGVRWYTNLDHKKRHEDLILYRTYSKKDYPKYDNYDAINVDKTKDIPMDYDGMMGVPISFMDKYNPNQFEIVWTTDRGGDGMLDGIKFQHTRYDAPVVNGKGIYKRIIIRRKA